MQKYNSRMFLISCPCHRHHAVTRISFYSFMSLLAKLLWTFGIIGYSSSRLLWGVLVKICLRCFTDTGDFDTLCLPLRVPWNLRLKMLSWACRTVVFSLTLDGHPLCLRPNHWIPLQARTKFNKNKCISAGGNFYNPVILLEFVWLSKWVVVLIMLLLSAIRPKTSRI